jgi:hypothetical protein
MTEAAGRSRLARRYPFGVAVLCLALAFWLSLNTMLDGFPDHYMSTLDAAEDQLVGVFNWISVAMAAWCMGLGIVAGRVEIRKPFFYVGTFYVAVIVVSLLIDMYFRATLMDSRGG